MIPDPLDHWFCRPIVGGRGCGGIVEEQGAARGILAIQRSFHRFQASVSRAFGQGAVLNGSELPRLVDHIPDRMRKSTALHSVEDYGRHRNLPFQPFAPGFSGN